MLSWSGRTLVTLSGKWSLGLGECGAFPSTVKKLPATPLFPVPMAASSAWSSGVMVPNCALPWTAAPTGATRRSWIIHPSYQPLSLLMTNSPRMSVKTSMNALGLSGSVGRPGFGSTTSRTPPMVDRPQFAPHEVNIAVALDARNSGGEDAGLEAGAVEEVVLEQLARAGGLRECLDRCHRVRAAVERAQPVPERGR